MMVFVIGDLYESINIEDEWDRRREDQAIKRRSRRTEWEE
jgi:hypothetical protein